MGKRKCSIQGCQHEHHARGFCNIHYKKYMRYTDPLAGTFRSEEIRRKGRQEDAVIQQEERKDIQAAQMGNYSFFLNQKVIERLFAEAYKGMHDPLYKTFNKDSIQEIILLTMRFAGYDKKDRAFEWLLVEELTELVEQKDKARFLSKLSAWADAYADYKERPKQYKQLKLFQLTN